MNYGVIKVMQHFVEVGLCRISANVSALRPDAPWLVFSNSLMTDHTIWAAQQAHFAGRYNILTYDQRGHGRSDAPAKVSFTELSGDVLALLDHFDIASCIYVGLSMGVPTGLNFAAGNPDRVAAMILSDGQMATQPSGRQTWQARIDQARAKGMAHVADDTVARWFDPAFIASGGAETLRKAAGKMQVDGYCACAAALQDYDFTAAAAGLTVPVQLLAGANDGAMPTVMAAMAETIPGASLSVIEGAGHIPNVEKPEAFNQAMETFLTFITKS